METRINYIYNHVLANFLIKRGVIPCGAGVGKFGDKFIQFKQCDRFQELLDLWNSKELIKNNK